VTILALELPNGLVNIDLAALAGTLHRKVGIPITPVPALDVAPDSAAGLELALRDKLFVLYPGVVTRATEDDAYTRAAATVRVPTQNKEERVRINERSGL
jgi:hypothetical protein